MLIRFIRFTIFAFFFLKAMNAISIEELPAFCEKLLAIQDGHRYRAIIKEDGIYLETPATLKREPEDTTSKEIRIELKKIFTPTQPAPYRIVHNENSFNVEVLHPFSDLWIPCFSEPISGTCTSQLPTHFFNDFPINLRNSEGIECGVWVRNPYKDAKRYRVQQLEEKRFTIQYNLASSEECEENWETVFEGTGIATPYLETDYRFGVYARWRSEHYGDQVAVLDAENKRFMLAPKVCGISYSYNHADTRVIAVRDKPGYPVRYEIWEGREKRTEYDTNVENFIQLAQIDLFYIPNTLDQSLPEDSPFRLVGMDIPVSRYLIGNIHLKPTLAYIKGGPQITKFGEFDATYHLLAQFFNVFVIEYRGSDSRMGTTTGSEKYLRGDIGGGVIRDVVSVLRAMKNKEHQYFQDINPSNMILAGHSFGGYVLAKIMQDYPDDIANFKGFLFLSPTLNILNNGKFNGLRNNSYVKNYMEYLLQGEDLEKRNSDRLIKYSDDLHRQLEQENQIVSPIHHMERMPKKVRALIIASTYDGNVSVEESMKFYVEWTRNFNPKLPIPEELLKLDTYDTLDMEKGIFSRTSPQKGELLEIFKVWHAAARTSLPFQFHFIDATHSYKDNPSVFQEYIQTVLRIND